MGIMEKIIETTTMGFYRCKLPHYFLVFGVQGLGFGVQDLGFRV